MASWSPKVLVGWGAAAVPLPTGSPLQVRRLDGESRLACLPGCCVPRLGVCCGSPVKACQPGPHPKRGQALSNPPLNVERGGLHVRQE